MSERQEILDIVDEVSKALDERSITFVVERDENDPNLFAFAAHDDADYVNVGFVGWNKNDSEVCFIAHDPMVENHDLAEGIPHDQSRCWWTPKNTEMFLMHLDGSARKIVEKARKIMLQNDA